MGETKMKKVITVLIVLVGLVIVGFGTFYYFFDDKGETRIENDKAEKDEDGRYLTIVNGTNQVINEVHVTVGDGTEIESCEQNNPDEDSFSVEIPDEYSEYTEFNVIFIDRFGMKYEKKINDVPESGRKEIKLTSDDYVKQSGDFKRKIDRFFNHD